MLPNEFMIAYYTRS